MKPDSMSLKEWLIKKLSLKIMVTEKVINVVIANQFETANVALANNDSVEISGFGTFRFNQKRAIKRMEKYKAQIVMYTKELNEEETTELRKKNLAIRIATLENNIIKLKPRIHES